MARTGRAVERPASRLKEFVLSNVRQLELHRALQGFYARWGELNAAERSFAFLIEAALERRSLDRTRGES